MYVQEGVCVLNEKSRYFLKKLYMGWDVGASSKRGGGLYCEVGGEALAYALTSVLCVGLGDFVAAIVIIVLVCFPSLPPPLPSSLALSL